MHSLWFSICILELLRDGQLNVKTITLFVCLFSKSSSRKPCGHKLLKAVTFKNGTQKLNPLRILLLQKHKSSIESILSRYGLPASCEEWRDWKVPPNLLCDAYDGQVWKDFIKNEFLSEPHNYALALNIDWFQPFTHTQYSVSVIYLVIMNLPRSIWFKVLSAIFLIFFSLLAPDRPSIKLFCWNLQFFLLFLFCHQQNNLAKAIKAGL